MKKISVIMPVFNTEEFVTESINSVLNQTYANFELIVINDNSNAECSEILEYMSRENKKIKLFQFPESQGVGAARNFGIQKSTGQFVYFLDSDDYLPETTLEILMENIKQNDMIKGRIKNTTFSSAMTILLEGLYKVKNYSDKKFNLIKNNSALNILIRKEFIKRNNLLFSENVTIYSDLFFMVPALINTNQFAYVKDAVYFKRKRNDPISNPSLTQLDTKIKSEDFLLAYNSLKQNYSDHLAQDFLDKQLFNFYRKTIITFFRDESQIDVLYPMLYESFNKAQISLIKQYDWVLVREIKMLNKSLKQYKKTIKRHQILREAKEALKSKRKFFIFLYRRLFFKLKLKENLVFFESFLGKNYSDSPKYIYQYMLNQNMQYKYVWSVNEKMNIPGNPIQVKRFSLQYFYYLARAKYWVNNMRMPRYLDKPKGNVFLQTWHGTPLKRLVFDMKDVHSADPNYKLNFYKQSRRWDYLNSPNQYSTDIFKRAFKFDNEILEFGYPRNDIFYQKNNEVEINALKAKAGLPIDKKVILYAPTWRDDEFFSRGNYKFTLQMNLEKMQRELSGEYVLLLRMHYFIANQIDVSEHKGFVFDFSSYDDIAELYLLSDILITDYSSVFFDYAHLKRPILFFTYDLEKYKDTLRGFYLDMEKDVPGPLLRTTDEVVNSISNINEVIASHQHQYEEFYNKFCLWDDGEAAKNTVETVFVSNT